MTRVGIAYGWGEGERHAKHLIQALHDAGFQITKELRDADVIIAHSGGCFMVPSVTKAKLIMLIGLPMWPGKHPMRSLGEKIKIEQKDLRWIRKTLYNTYYTISKPRHLFDMWRAWKKLSYPILQNKTFVLIRNEHDGFLHPGEFLAVSEARGWQTETLPGQHDDLWLKPEPYVGLLRKHYGLLA